jgi:ABC-type transport system involved in cytochrome c biogenesis permease subunit
MEGLHRSEVMLAAVAFVGFAIAAAVYFVALGAKWRGIAWGAFGLTAVGLVLLTIAVVLRGVQQGHLPFSGGYDFALCFAWGIVAAQLGVELAFKRLGVGAVALPIAVFIYLWGRQYGAEVEVGLMAALKNPFWLTVHVITAIVAYGVLAVSAGTAVLQLLSGWLRASWLPEADWLDMATYKVIAFGFPFLTLVIITGAVWAETAWGRPWGWDQKETASLIAWFLYAVYLHVRLLRGWKGAGTAAFALVGFAGVLFAYIAPNFLGGLHSYGQ